MSERGFEGRHAPSPGIKGNIKEQYPAALLVDGQFGLPLAAHRL